MFEGGGGGGGVDLALDFKNFWDGVYNFFFCPSSQTVKFVFTLVIQYLHVIHTVRV